MTTIHKKGMWVVALGAVLLTVLPISVHAKLEFVDWYQDGEITDGLDGAYSVTVSPDEKHVYVAGEEDDAVAVFARKVFCVTPVIELLLLSN